MGQHNVIVEFPGKKLMIKRDQFKKDLAKLREQLLPYYEDDEAALDKDIEKKKNSEVGAVGLMAAIAWCHGQIGLYKTLNDMQDDE